MIDDVAGPVSAVRLRVRHVNNLEILSVIMTSFVSEIKSFCATFGIMYHW